MKIEITPKNLRAAGMVVAVLVGIGIFAYQNIISRRSGTFLTHEFAFERDGMSNLETPIPLSKVYSQELMAAYQAGDGFAVTFKTNSDPRKNFEATEFTCSLPQAARKGLDPFDRKVLVEEKRKELDECIKKFEAPIPQETTLEIGVDETEGVSEVLRQLVLLRLEGVEQSLVSDIDSTTVFLFRLSNTDYLNFRPPFKVGPKTPVEQISRQLKEGIEWLLMDRGLKAESSVATGLFNNLKVNEKIRKRRILIFGDGMEHNSKTVSFYELMKDPNFLDKSRWEALDKSISRFEPFPNLQYADVVWYFPPRDWIEYRFVHNYWEHVLKDKANARSVDAVY